MAASWSLQETWMRSYIQGLSVMPRTEHILNTLCLFFCLVVVGVFSYPVQYSEPDRILFSRFIDICSSFTSVSKTLFSCIIYLFNWSIDDFQCCVRFWGIAKWLSLYILYMCACVCEKKKVKVLVTQLYPTLCDPLVCNLPGSSVHGIFQVRILEWVAIPFIRGSSQPRDWTWVSCIACRFFTIQATKEAHTCIFFFILFPLWFITAYWI